MQFDLFNNNYNNENSFPFISLEENFLYNHSIDLLQDTTDDFQHIELNKNSKKIAKQPKLESPTSSTKSPKTRAVRNLWKAHEDELLLQLYAQHGPKWTLIGRLIGGRACKQVRDRYLNNLRPDINNSPFSQQEDEQLVSLYYQLGTKWKDIAARMAGRTQSQVKNRFYLHLKDSLQNFKIEPLAITKTESTSTAATEHDQSSDFVSSHSDLDMGFGFIQYNQDNFRELDLKFDENFFASNQASYHYGKFAQNISSLIENNF